MPSTPEITIRRATPADVPACAQITLDAFTAISRAHNFPPDIPSLDVALQFLGFLFSAPNFFCVVAESGGRILGSNVLDERSIILGIGPITVDPATQNRGVGRLLMQSVLDRARQQRAPGVRLVQAAFHNRSLSLYTTLGFDVREPLACMQRAGSTGGTETATTPEPRIREIPGHTVRPATPDDIPACAALSLAVHGFDRSPELPLGIRAGRARVTLRAGRITAYTTALGFFGHSTAETLTDLQALIASADTFLGPGILVPTRNAELFRWCLANGLRVTQPMTLMSLGLYNHPAGAFLPSVTF
jgi:predicted N-acetyltransferase YhbS